MTTENTDDVEQSESANAVFDDDRACDWYHQLVEEVDFHCSFCDALHMKVSEMEAKVKEAYASTARSMDGLFDAKEIANRWLGLWYLATGMLYAAQAANDAHKICGVDLSTLEAHRDAAWERFQLHCPEIITCG